MHSSHRVGHAVGRGTCRHIVGVQSSARAAAGSHGEISFAVVDSPFFVGACNGVLESGGVGGISRDGNVHAFMLHNRNAFPYVVRAVATYFCLFAVGVSDGVYNLKLAREIVVFGLDVGKAVDAGNNHGSVR